MSNFSSRSKIISTASIDSSPRSSSRSVNSTVGFSTLFFLAMMPTTSFVTSVIENSPPLQDLLLDRLLDALQPGTEFVDLPMQPLLPAEISELLDRPVMRLRGIDRHEAARRHVAAHTRAGRNDRLVADRPAAGDPG